MAGKNRKTEFLDAALKCVEEHGVFETNADKVCKVLKVSRTSFFYYFPTQRDFRRELLAHAVTIGQSVIDALTVAKSPSIWGKLRNRISGNMRWAEKYPAHMDILAFGFLACQQDKSSNDFTLQTLRGGEQSFYQIVAAGYAEKEFDSELPPMSVAIRITKATLGAMLDVNISHDRRERCAYLEKELHDFAARLVGVRGK